MMIPELLHLMWWKGIYQRFHSHRVNWNIHHICVIFLRVMGECLCLWKNTKCNHLGPNYYYFYTNIDPFHHFIPICFTEKWWNLGTCTDLARINDKGELLEHQELGLLRRSYGLLCSLVCIERVCYHSPSTKWRLTMVVAERINHLCNVL